MIGAIYVGKNISRENSKAHLYPMAFFWRRSFFVIATVFLFDWPTMQMMAHILLTVAMVVLLISDKHGQESYG